MGNLRLTPALLDTLPEWAKRHISFVKAERDAANIRADNAERQVRDMARELKRLALELRKPV